MEAQELVEADTHLIAKAGFKTAGSRTYEVLRIALIWGILYLVCSAIIDDINTTPTMDDLSDEIKPGTLIHRALTELDEESRSKCIKSLSNMFQSPQSAPKKYAKAVRVGLMAGFLTEFIVNGNAAKPIGVVTRTITYSVLATLFA